MSIKDKYKVEPIKKQETREWLLHKHYAKRVPPIQHAFGLYKNILQGVCTFGPPARMLNDGYGCFGGEIKVKTYELNHLVINEGLEKNVLSLFVCRCLKLLPKPTCVVSYADGNKNHHGYIYQATNWVYTGITKGEKIYTNEQNGKQIHARTVVEMFGSRESSILPEWIKINNEVSGKYRYFKFLGTKKEAKRMRNKLQYPILPYPKGDNERYDADYKPVVQLKLFV